MPRLWLNNTSPTPLPKISAKPDIRTLRQYNTSPLNKKPKLLATGTLALTPGWSDLKTTLNRIGSEMAATRNQQNQLPSINDAHHYWLYTAYTMPAAQALAERIGIELQGTQGFGFKYGMVYPIRRLIIVGEDRADNFATLFGENWEVGIGDLWKNTRIEVLLCPPAGSPSHTMAGALDEGAGTWRPRPPTVEEEAKIREVHAMSRLLSGLGA